MKTMSKLGEELSAAVALTTLGGANSSPQLGSSINSRPALTHPLYGEDLLRLQLQQRCSSIAAATPSIAGYTTILPDSRNNSETPKTKTNNKKKRNFAQKLFDVLDTGCHSDVIAWLPGGKAFIVLDKRRFASEVLPHYFKESQYTSFTRKLSRWKFSRISRGQYMGAYYHKNFRRENRDLCARMSCSNSTKLPKKDLNKGDDDESNGEPPVIESPVKENVGEHKLKSSRSSSPIEESKKKNSAQNANNSEDNLTSTNRSIQLIKEQLLMIRMEKAKVEERKRNLLMMQTEAARLKEIQRLKAAVNLSIQEAELRLRAAASRAMGSRERIESANIHFPMNYYPTPLQQIQSQFQYLQQSRAANSSSDPNQQNSSRAFAA
jgi:hypothetical protein